MKFNVSLSDCEKSIAINATLVAFMAVVVIISAIFISIFNAITAAIILVYGAVKLDRAVIIKKDIVANGESTTAVLLKEAGKSIGASAYLMASSAIMMIVSFVFLWWFYGIAYLIVFIYTAIELSVAVSLRDEVAKGKREDKMTQTAINSCVERILGGGAAMLVLTAGLMIYGIFSVISVAMFFGKEHFEETTLFGIEKLVVMLMNNLSITLLVFALFVYLAVKVAMADKAKKNYARQAKAQLEAPEVLEEVPVEQAE